MKTFKKESKKKTKKKHSLSKIMKRVLLLLIIGLFIVIIYGGCYIYSKIENNISESVNKSNKIISEMSKDDFNSRTPTNIYDKDGNLIKQLKTVDYVYKKYDELNPIVFKALIAVEDNRFYEHDGIDLKGLARSMYSSVVRHQSQGGSTITQQLAKNVYLTMDKTLWRKISEAVIAQELEKRYSKHQILEFYVNNINYGNGCYSIESAANYYFGKSTKDLSIAEIALLTGIPNNPTIYDPITKFKNVNNRKDSILNMISKKQLDEEKNREIVLNIKKSELDNVVTDYAQSYAVHEAVEFIMSYYGFQFKYDFANEEERKTYWNTYDTEYKKYYSELITGGYDIYTSINQNIQNQLQQIVNSKMSIYTDINNSTGIYKKQSSATVIDNKTDLVIGIVGGRTQDGVNNSYNRAFLAARQPGSTIKPIIVYTPAIENGYNANSTLVDEYIQNGPKNAYSGYTGKVSLRTAVAKSINTVAYKLTQEVGVEKSLNYLSNMKYKYLSPTDKESKTIGLGGFTYGTTTVEMASAYSTLARNGQYIDATNITKIYDRTTKETIYENTYETKKIYDDGAAYLMTDVLKSVLTDGTGKSFQLPNISEQAGKTGTTNSEKDLWFCGYTPSYSMAVWVGDDIPTSQGHLSTQGYIWKEMMTRLNEGHSDEIFEKPSCVYSENGTLKYKKTKTDSKLIKNTSDEKSRLNAETNAIVTFSYKNDINVIDTDEILNGYIKLFNNLSITSAEDFPIIAKYIENGDQIKNKSSNTKLIKSYENAKSKVKSKVQMIKDSYNKQVRQQEESQMDSIWNNILSDFNNRKPSITLPSQNIITTPELTPPNDNQDNQTNNNQNTENNEENSSDNTQENTQDNNQTNKNDTNQNAENQ